MRKIVKNISIITIYYLWPGVLFILLFPPTLLEGVIGQLDISAICIFFICLAFFFRPKSKSFTIPVLPLSLLILISISISRSSNGGDSFKSCLLFTTIFFTSIYFSEKPQKTSVSLLAALVLIVVLNFTLLIIELLASQYSIETFRGFAGFYSNPNGLAFVLISATPLLLSYPFSRGVGVWSKYILLMLILILVLVSKSETSIYTFFILICTTLILKFGGKKILSSVLVLVSFTIVGFFAVLRFPLLLKIIGKDPTIDGRTPLWDVVVKQIFQNHLLGMGWSTSWPNDSMIFHKVLELGKPLFHAHNEALNWLLTTGILGLILILAIYLSLIVGGGFLIASREIRLGKLAILSGVAFFVRGLTDISETNAQGWLMLCFALAASSVYLLRKSNRRIQLYFWPLRISNNSTVSDF